MLRADEYPPAGHGEGVVAPAPHHEPAGHAAHAAALVAFTVALYVPAAHCVGVDEPATQ